MSAPLRVAYQGEPGAFSEDAILALHGETVERVPARSFKAVVDALRTGAVDRAVVPVHNSIAGEVTTSLAAIRAYPGIEILRSVVIPIRMCLLGVAGTRIATLRQVLSHPVALAQCGLFLRQHPAITAIAVDDTAGAARIVAERQDIRVAAVAARGAGARYGLSILAEDVHDRSDNVTQFVECARRTAETKDRATASLSDRR